MIIFFVLGVIEWEYLLRLSGQEWIGPSETLIDQVYAGAVILGFLLFEKFNLPLAAQLADLHALIEHLSEMNKKLEKACPLDWSKEKEEIEAKKVELHRKIDIWDSEHLAVLVDN